MAEFLYFEFIHVTFQPLYLKTDSTLLYHFLGIFADSKFESVKLPAAL